MAADERPGWRRWLVGWAELAGFWALAIAWPVYQRLTAGTESLTGLGIRRLDLVVFVAIVSLLVPTILILLELAVVRIAKRPDWRRPIQAVLLGSMISLFAWQQIETLPGLLKLVIPLGVLVAFVAGYLRTEFIRNFAALLAVATPVVIVFFALSYPVKEELLPGEPGMAAQSTEADAPVVIVVLDELPLASVVTDRDEIDPRYFPALAALQDESTWYRNALTVADNTLSAVPTILSGEKPSEGGFFTEREPPNRNAYPDNVCSTAEKAGYRIVGQELVTDLCARGDGLGTRLAALLEQGLPAKAPEGLPDSIEVPPVERVTPFGMLEKSVDRIAGLFPEVTNNFDLERNQALIDFTDDLSADTRTMSVIHVALPHAEYQRLPDGRSYFSHDITDVETIAHRELPVNRRESARDLQQYTAQMMYTDRLIGEMVDRMKENGTWEDSLFVLTADHGVSFGLGAPRRSLTEDNAGWLMPVPLFIKYPGQTEGKVVDAAVDSTDIEPTVLDTIGLEAGPDSIGRSLLGAIPAPVQPTATAVSSLGGSVTLSRKEIKRQEREAIRERNRIFSSGNVNAIGGHAGLIGTKAAAHEGLEPLGFEPDPISDYSDVVLGGDSVPAYFQAMLPGTDADPGALAVSLNGVIAATTRAWKRNGVWMTAVNLDPDAFIEGDNEVAVYSIDGD